MMRLLTGVTFVPAVLLLAACGSSRPTTETTPEPAAPMNSAAIQAPSPAPVVMATVPATTKEERIARTTQGAGFDGAVNSAYGGGEVEREVNYEDGAKHGKWVTYHANGQVFQQGAYVAGKKDGPWVEFYPSGQKLEESEWDQGLAVGMHRSWLPDGTLVVEKDMSRGF